MKFPWIKSKSCLEIALPLHSSAIYYITDYGHTKAKSLICGPNSNLNIMENMDKGFTVPKWVLIVRPKIPQMPQNLSVQFDFPSPKILDFNEKRLHWASVVHALFE